MPNSAMSRWWIRCDRAFMSAIFVRTSSTAPPCSTYESAKVAIDSRPLSLSPPAKTGGWIPGFGDRDRVAHAEVLALVGERGVLPEPTENVDEFAGLPLSVVVPGEGATVLPGFLLPPRGGDVEREPCRTGIGCSGDVGDRRRFLRGDRRQVGKW
ncbi:hypothetical protein [Rhodococcus oxybenzonivorans]|uniref:hypothetical protein n=1 Tax=Rhodococcus oxybenzonivorans TaxID=1990687 RepID=UPI001E560C95|nr:hypothetical protein [Rhodococcus oxybenzonivorans]